MRRALRGRRHPRTRPGSGRAGHRVRRRLRRRARSRPGSARSIGSWPAGSAPPAAAAAAACPTTPASTIVAATAPTTSAVLLLSCGCDSLRGRLQARTAVAPTSAADARVVDPVAGPGHLAAGAHRRAARDAEVRAGQQRHLARGAVRRPVGGVLQAAAGARRLQRGLEHREVQEVAQPDHQRGRDQRTPHEADDGTRGALEPGGEEQAALERRCSRSAPRPGRGSRPA